MDLSRQTLGLANSTAEAPAPCKWVPLTCCNMHPSHHCALVLPLLACDGVRGFHFLNLGDIIRWAVFLLYNQPPCGLQITLYEKETGMFNHTFRVCSLLKLLISTDRKLDWPSQLLPDVGVFQRQYEHQGFSTMCRKSTQAYRT